MKLLDRYARESNDGEVEKSSILGRVVVGKNAKIVNSKIIGPAYIGDGVEIYDSIIGAYSSIGNFSKIRKSQISYSLVFENSLLENVDISDSIVGKSSVLEREAEELGSSRFIIGENTNIRVR